MQYMYMYVVSGKLF